MNSVCLEPNYTPSGIISNVDTAVSIIYDSGLNVPNPANPECDLNKWRKVLDLFTIPVITDISKKISEYNISNVFKTLSIKLDPNTPYDVEDILTIKVSSGLQHTKQSEIKHCKTVFTYCIDRLPPVTAGLVGGFLSEVRLFEHEEYMKYLPDEKRYGGLHKPFRKSMDVVGECRCMIDTHVDDYPDITSGLSCTFLHELGHVVHNIYGALRPGDHGYTYPSQKNTLSSTGFIEPITLSEKQAQFVYNLIQSYVYTQMDCYDTVRYDDYSTSHPAEAFACAFEVCLRKGDTHLYEEYSQFQNTFNQLI